MDSLDSMERVVAHIDAVHRHIHHLLEQAVAADADGRLSHFRADYEIAYDALTRAHACLQDARWAVCKWATS